MHVTRKAGERCVIGHTPQSYLEANPKYKEDEFAGPFQHGGNWYMTKTSFSKKCSLKDDIVAHPILNFVSQVLGAIFAVLVCCLAMTCCQYKKVSNQYEEIRQSLPTADSRIVDRNAKSTEEEDRPRRRNRPDPNTFGKRSPDEIEESKRRADSEIELGELDVDFA